MSPRGGSGSGRRAPSGQPGEIFLEFIPIGKMMRVVAIDAASGLETTIMGPANASRADLERVAVRKLKMMLSRQSPV